MAPAGVVISQLICYHNTMKVLATHKGKTRASDTISVFDNDGREIAIRRRQIDGLIKHLKSAKRK